MGWFDRVSTLWPVRRTTRLSILGDLTERREMVERAMREAKGETTEAYLSTSGTTIDDDDWQYRRLSAGGRGTMRRDLLPVQHDKMLQIAWHLVETNALAGRLIDLMTDLVVGEGFSVSASDDRIAEILQETWNHPRNELSQRCIEFYRAASVNGELIVPVARNPITGIPTFGFIDPMAVKEVRNMPGNALIADEIELHTESGTGQGQRLKVVNWNPETGRLEGDVFYRRFNALPNSGRGRSDLIRIADYCDIYDSLLFGELERLKALSSFVWDYEIDTTDENIVRSKVQRLGTPTPGMVFGHNSKEKLEARTPNLNGADRSEVVKMLAIHIGGTFGYPISWLGFPDSNRATIEGQNDVMLKTPARRQKQYVAFIAQLMQYALEGATTVNPSYYRSRDYGFKVDVPEIAAKDVARVGGVIASVMQAMDVGMANSTMSRRAAMVVISSIIKHLGVNLDVNEVMREADQEQAERQAKDDERMAQLAAANAQRAAALQGGKQPQPDPEEVPA